VGCNGYAGQGLPDDGGTRWPCDERVVELPGGGTAPMWTGGRMVVDGSGGVPATRGVLGGGW
jgi:hypothetical protein